MATELNGCPFCGVQMVPQVLDGIPRAVTVWNHPEVDGGCIGDELAFADTDIHLWNRRTPPSPPLGVEELEAMLAADRLAVVLGKAPAEGWATRCARAILARIEGGVK